MKANKAKKVLEPEEKNKASTKTRGRAKGPNIVEANEARNTITADRVTARADSQRDVRVNRAEWTIDETTTEVAGSKLRNKRETRWLRKRKKRKRLPAGEERKLDQEGTKTR